MRKLQSILTTSIVWVYILDPSSTMDPVQVRGSHPFSLRLNLIVGYHILPTMCFACSNGDSLWPLVWTVVEFQSTTQLPLDPACPSKSLYIDMRWHSRAIFFKHVTLSQVHVQDFSLPHVHCCYCSWSLSQRSLWSTGYGPTIYWS